MAKAQAAFITRDSNLQPRSGVLGDVSGLVTAESSAWALRVKPFTYVKADGMGVSVAGTDSDTVLPIASASRIPRNQYRTDLIVWQHESASLQVIAGKVGVSTAPPNTPRGSEAFAKIIVAANQTRPYQQSIHELYDMTALTGTPFTVRDIRERDGLSPLPGQEVRVRYDRNAIHKWTGRTWVRPAGQRVFAGIIEQVEVAANSVYNESIFFPNELFDSRDKINVQTTLSGHGWGFQTHTRNITHTGCNIQVSNTTNTPQTLDVHYVAQQL